jgi:hypothetical protein
MYHASIKDPLAKDGGAAEVVRRELQAVGDLEARIVSIRTAIQRANLETPISVEGQTRSIAEWLAWRKDVLPALKGFLGNTQNGIVSQRREFQKKNPGAPAEDVIVNIDEKALAEQIEKLNTIELTLDGQLSLKNATVLIAV